MGLGAGRGRGLGSGAALFALTGALLALSAGTAAGAQPEQLIKFPGDGLAGSGAGRMQIPKGIAASPVNGGVYVVDAANNERIDEFSGWGQFVRAFGWDVVANNVGTGFEICEPAEGDICKAGTSGSGAGQIGDRRPAGGIGVDPETGDLYATDMGLNHRVQKFSATGEFLLMFGGEVNKTTGADVCTQADIEGGDVCGAGVTGSGDGEFLAKEFGSYLAVSPDGETVYVGDKDRIQEFGSDGTFKGQIRFEDLHAEDEEFPESGFALGLAADPLSGDLYVIASTTAIDFSGVRKDVFRIDPLNGLKGTLTAPTLMKPTAVATDAEGNVYVVNRGEFRGEILEFDSAGKKLIPDAEEEAIFEAEAEAKSKEEPFEHFARFGEPPIEGSNEEIELTGIATDSGCEAESDDLYATYSRQGGGGITRLAYVNSFGPAPQNALKCPPPPPEPPEIVAQYATAVGTTSAKLRADINPHYDTSTTYYLEYGTAECSEGEGGCGTEKPLPPGTQLTTKIVNATIRSGAIVIGGLEEATTYHYRFVAENSKGTVRGEGGEVGADGAEGTFTTFPTPSSPENPCPNQEFRTGFSSRLTDCRAYELVSPAKRSPTGDVVTGLNVLAYPAELNQASTDGEKLAYSSEFAFGDAVGAPLTTEYIATRHAGEGWSTHAISPQRESQPLNDNARIKKDIEEKAFTADLCSSWLMHDTDPVLDEEGGIEGFPNIYRRDNCEPGADTYRGITSVQPPDTDANLYWPEVQGFSADGSRAVFRANAKLAEDAPDLGSSAYHTDSQLYEWSEGAIRFICMLPDGSPLAGRCSAGTANSDGREGRVNQVKQAVSADGRRVFWTTSESAGSQLYLRENADAEQSPMSAGKCTEPETKACTYKVSSGAARFWTAAADGSLALYTEGDQDKLREFSAASKSSKTIAEGVPGVAGASEDLARIYFVSRKELGGEGEEGEPNLYLREAGGTKLVATLAEEDMSQSAYLALNPAAESPIAHGARTTADGQHLVFASTASLTGYDNRDAEGSKPDAEVFLYDAGAGGPVCISCNPSGARPAGRVLVTEGGTSKAAALIPAAETQLYAPKIITEDGNRIFFNSFDSLLARDNNGAEDVYEWERAGGAQDCEELGADLYVPSSGGCLSLISSGEGSQDSTYLDMSIENGARDVFFKTGQSLVPEDPGLIDIYDAREGGGLPEPRPEIVCEPGLCPGAAGPPQDPTPSSSSFEAPEEAKQKPHCPKGKHRVNGKCVKKHKPKPKHRSAKAGRR